MAQRPVPDRAPAAGRSFLKSATLLGRLTLVSRVLGYLRDSLNAALFGAGWVADSYFVAFRIPNLLRDLVGEGALSSALVPTLSRLLGGGRAGSPREASKLLSALLTWVALGGVALVVAGGLAAPWIVRAIAPGFAAFPRGFALTVSLTRWLFPFIVFMSLAATVQGWLTARERFGPQAYAPVALNVCVIAGGVLFTRFSLRPEWQIYGWTAGVLLGGAAQWLVQVPAARDSGFAFRWRLWHPAMRDVGALMIPAMIGFSITQLYLLVNTILASLLPEGSVARIYYGNRLMQLPLGVFGIAIATATYPVVAQAFVAGRPARAAAALNRALRLAAFAVLPASAGLIALSAPINALLFRYGRFTLEDAGITAAVSSAYAIGVIGHVCNRVLAPSFYAAGRPFLPVEVDGVGLLANALLSSVLMLRFGVIGLPISTSIVVIATSAWLGWRLSWLVPGLGRDGVGRVVVRSLLAAVVMGLVVWVAAGRAETALAAAHLGRKAREALVTFGGMGLGVGVYGLLAHGLGVEELGEIRALLLRRR